MRTARAIPAIASSSVSPSASTRNVVAGATRARPASSCAPSRCNARASDRPDDAVKGATIAWRACAIVSP
eukprot:scaffold95929_cov28-Tisochrysis_lutea.AAC.3